jgi:hypothetical protein
MHSVLFQGEVPPFNVRHQRTTFCLMHYFMPPLLNDVDIYLTHLMLQFLHLPELVYTYAR